MRGPVEALVGYQSLVVSFGLQVEKVRIAEQAKALAGRQLAILINQYNQWDAKTREAAFLEREKAATFVTATCSYCGKVVEQEKKSLELLIAPGPP